MHHFYNSWQTRFQNLDPLHSTHSNHFRFHRGRMMYYRGPSRLLWFAVGAFTATWYHRAHARGEFRGWGPCGNRRIEEWRAERATEAAMKDQFPTTQQKGNETTGEWPWRPTARPPSENEEVHRRWEEKAKKAQETVCILSYFNPARVLTENF